MVLGFLIITKHRLNGKGRMGGYHGEAYPPTGCSRAMIMFSNSPLQNTDIRYNKAKEKAKKLTV